MHITLYEASVPVFERYLRNLAALVTLAQAHAARCEIEPSAVLQTRLAPSMFPFSMQVEIAAQFSLRACAPLAGLDVPQHGEHATTFEALAARIARALDFLAALTPAQIQGAADRGVRSKAGLETLVLPGRVFLLQYAMPNFMFHLSAAYCILRQLGVPVGKGSFDGFHVYGPQP
jgi:uncharacterized protein